MGGRERLEGRQGFCGSVRSRGMGEPFRDNRKTSSGMPALLFETDDKSNQAITKGHRGIVDAAKGGYGFAWPDQSSLLPRG